MADTPHPELRGRLRAAGAISTEAIVGSRGRRWTITVVLLGLVALVAAVSAIVGLPFAIGMAVALGVVLVAGVWILVVTTPARDRPIAGAFLMTGRRELSRFRAATGTRLPPRTAWGMRRWLGARPETAADRTVRATYFVCLGRYDEAVAVIDRIESSGPFERFGKERLGAIVDFERGGAGDLDATRRAFAAIEDPGDRAVASWQLAVEDARQRYVLGGDWRAPLENAAGSGDPRARSVRAWLPTVVWAAAPALVAIYLLALVVELVATGSVL